MSVENLASRQLELRRRLPMTPGPFSENRQIINPPMEIGGMRILDIGAGLTNRSMGFRERGALGVAVDINYSQSEQEIADVAKVTIHGFRRHPVGDAGKYLQAISGFARDFIASNKKGTYITATTLSLPFKDNTFDFAYSIHCLASFMHDPELFKIAVNEALRVIKPGAKLQVSPFYDQSVVDMSSAMGFKLPGGVDQAQEFLREEGFEFAIHPTKQEGAFYIEFVK